MNANSREQRVRQDWECDETRSAPEPLPSSLPSVPAFDADLLPDSIRAWCMDAADGLQVPLDFTAIPAMVGLAGALGRRIGVAMKRNEPWIEVPMLWACVIGRPSSGKSPALAPTARMLKRLEDRVQEVFDQDLREYKAREMVADASKATAKEAIKLALKNRDERAATAAAKNALFDEEAPTEPRLVVNDPTVEKLGELLRANPNGLTLFRDELSGWLATLDREGHESDRSFWLEAWNGSNPFTVDRIGRGTIRIPACAICILGGMQPGKLAAYVRGAVQGGFGDDGLMQRFQLAVFPDLPASWQYVDRSSNREADTSAWQAFQRLHTLTPDAVGAEYREGADVPFLRFDDEAQDDLIEWQTQLMHRLRSGSESAWMESHLSKYRALAGRLALVLHLADNGSGPIPARTLAKALDWCEYLECHARRIYAPAGDDGLTAAHLILKRRAELGDRFTARDVQRKCWAGLNDHDDIGEGLELLTDHRHLLAITESGIGRPSTIYSWRRVT